MYLNMIFYTRPCPCIASTHKLLRVTYTCRYDNFTKIQDYHHFETIVARHI
jgi:hypothetical protein